MSLSLEISNNECIFSIESSLVTLESSMKDLESYFRPIQSNLARLNDRFEQQGLSSQITVFGVKGDVFIENTESRFMSLCAGKFPGIPITQSDVVSAKRIGKPSAKARPTIVQFCNLRVKNIRYYKRQFGRNCRVLEADYLKFPSKEDFFKINDECWPSADHVATCTGGQARGFSNIQGRFVRKYRSKSRG
jgi:hypothetical protein